MSFYWRSVNLWNTRSVSYIETLGYSTPYNPMTSAALVEIVFVRWRDEPIRLGAKKVLSALSG
jgi:hypothetical protein